MRVAFLLLRIECNYAGWVRVLPPTAHEPHRPDLKKPAVDAWRARGPRYGRWPTPMVEFTFHDAAGRWWLRDEHGVLTEIDKADRFRYAKDADVTVS